MTFFIRVAVGIISRNPPKGSEIDTTIQRCMVQELFSGSMLFFFRRASTPAAAIALNLSGVILAKPFTMPVFPLPALPPNLPSATAAAFFFRFGIGTILSDLYKSVGGFVQRRMVPA